MKEKVIITGISKGIGRAMAEEYRDRGYNVIGTCRNPDQLTDKLEGVTYAALEMNDRESIDRFAGQYSDADILINNAGQSQISPSEIIPASEIDRYFDLNIINLIYLTNKYIPGMRERRKGTIVNISSMQGRMPLPFCSIYSATKHALEGYSKSLHHELLNFGVRVIVISPGFIKTTIKQKSYIEGSSPYHEDYMKVKSYRDGNISRGVSAQSLAEEIVRITGLKNPSMSYVLGGKSPFLYFLVKILPERLLKKVFRKILNL